MSDHVLIDRSEGVLTLTLNRPERKNALTRDMYRILGEVIDGANEDPAARCILIQAEGDLFCSGNDIADFAAINAGEAERPTTNPLLAALARAKKPIVAAVQGKAVGVGATLLLHCDLVYMTPEAGLKTPFADLALSPEAASSLLLPARIGHVRAFSMFVLGETLAAADAVNWGLANGLVPAGELREKARAAAVAVAARPPASVAITKALMRDPEVIATRIAEEIVHFTARLKSPEAKEAFAAFAEKRAPDYSKFD